MRVLLVRHAHAGSKKAFVGDDDLRPLDRRGRRQAEGLSRALGKPRPSAIYSSPSARCIQTVEPLATRLSIAVQPAPALATDAGRQALVLIDELAANAGGTVVLCTHREVLTLVLPELGTQFHRPLGHRLPGAKGGTWMLDFRRQKLASVRYLPPPR
jgi:8-oxo-(d)GTP phosphatase